MPVPEVWVERLAALAIECRPHGAPQWDMPGTMTAVRKVQHLELAEVAAACARAGADRTLRTPAAIGDTTSSAWRERFAEHGPTKARICAVHGTQYRGSACPSCRADELGADGPAPRARPRRGLEPGAAASAVDELRDHAHHTEETA